MREGLQLNPALPHYLSGLADIAQERGDIEQALIFCTQIRSRFPHVREGYIVAATCLVKQGRSDTAEEIMQEAIRRLPADREVRIYFARAADWRADWPEAFKRWSAVLEDAPWTYIKFGVAQALRGMGKLDEARAIIEEVLRVTPGDHTAYIELAKVAAAEGKFEEVLECWASVRRKAPLLVRGYIEGAAIAKAAGRIEEADDILRQGTEHLPDNLQIHLQYAENIDDLRDPDGAEERRQLIRSRFPDRDSAAPNRG